MPSLLGQINSCPSRGLRTRVREVDEAAVVAALVEAEAVVVRVDAVVEALVVEEVEEEGEVDLGAEEADLVEVGPVVASRSWSERRERRNLVIAALLIS